MSPRVLELVTNSDGRLSTTATVQLCGFAVLALVLLVSVILDRASATDLYGWFAVYCGGLTVSKGAVSAYRERNKGGNDDA